MSDALLGAIAVVSAVVLATIIVAAGLAGQPPRPSRASARAGSRSVALGTVQAVADVDDPVVVVEVESVTGQRFTGRLCHRSGDPAISALRPGLILLVAFDPAARDRLTLADDVAAVRAVCAQSLLRKGLLTGEQLDLIRHGVRSSGVVTGVRVTGRSGADCRTVELDLMVRRCGGGQFPAREMAVVPESSLPRLGPGSIVDAYYRPEDETTVAVCLPLG